MERSDYFFQFFYEDVLKNVKISLQQWRSDSLESTRVRQQKKRSWFYFEFNI